MAHTGSSDSTGKGDGVREDVLIVYNSVRWRVRIGVAGIRPDRMRTLAGVNG